MARQIPISGIIVLTIFLLTSNMTEVAQSTFMEGDGVGTIFSDQQDAIMLRNLLEKATPATPASILNIIVSLLSSPLGVQVKYLATKQIFSFAMKYGMDKILRKPEEEKIGKLVACFDRISNEQNALEKEIESLRQDILKLGLAVSYDSSETTIKTSLSLLRRHLDKPDDPHIRDEFYKEAAKIPKRVEKIMDGLLGRHTFSENILSALRDINQCHGRKLNEKVFTLMTIVMTGVEVYKQFLRMKNPNQSEPSSVFSKSKFAQTLTESVNEVTKRLDDIVLQCRMDERTLDNEMREIIIQNSDKSKDDLANALHHFLEDKYDTKKWAVFTFFDDYRKSGLVKTVQTGGFHMISANGVFVLAVSNGGSNNDTLNDANQQEALLLRKQRSYLDQFKIPYDLEIDRDSFLNSKRSTNSSDVKVIHDYLGRYLTPLRTDKQFDVEFLVYSYEDCREKLPSIYGHHVLSVGLEHLFLTHTSCSDVSKLPSYRTAKVLVVPKRSSSWNSTLLAGPQHRTNNLNCFPINWGRMLRNEFSQGYLSAPDGSENNKDAGVVADRQWRNTPGQRWRFIDNTLRNDGGSYCLTVIGNTTSGTSSFLLSARCDPGSRSQMWIRHGLQIVRPFEQHDDHSNMYCVGVDGKSDGHLPIVLGKCSTNPRYLWYHWDTDCEDDMVVHGASNNSNGQPLRNEFSRRFLGVQDDQVKHGPWMNLPGQRWRFVDGQLMNDDGLCLIIGHGWYYTSYIEKKNCAEAKKLLIHSNWEYNEKRQIVSKSGRGYCLTSINELNEMPGIIRSFFSGLFRVFHRILHPIIEAVVGFSSISKRTSSDVHIDDCKDVPQQKWDGFFTTVRKNE